MVKLWCAVSALAILSTAIPTVFAQNQGQWTSTGAMQSTRELSAQLLLANGNVLTVGGVDNNNNTLAAAEVYSPSLGTWKATGNMAQPREYFAAVVLKNGKVLVVGGLGTSNIVLLGAELYNPSTGTWSSAHSLSVPRYGHTATLLPSGKVLVTGGCTSNTGCTDTAVSEIYDPTTNSWSTTGNLNTSRHYHSAVLLQTGKVLAVGGYNGSATTTSCEVYDPSTGAWTSAASTSTARYRNTTTLLSDGKVLVTGGANGKYPLTSAELYNPSANTWTVTGSMKIGRYSHTATLLPDGTVVAAGGVGQPISCGKACVGYIPTAKVDIYNESTGTFTATGALSRSRAYQATTLLNTGVALTSGGLSTTNTCCVVVNSAEFYTPLSLTFSVTSLNFGFLEVGLTSSAQTVTVNNVSNHSVTFTSIAASGDFSQTNNCPATLPMNQSCTISVTFTPTVAGPRSGAVTLKDNSPGSPQQTIALSGSGGAGALTFTVSSLNFGGVIPGYSSYQNATLINDSAAAVNITDVSIAPANGTFTSTNNCPATLNPQQSCVFQVVFSPPDTGNYSATLTVTNSGNGAPASLQLAGTGLD
jgi:N-acetylneuraminic acid mutarotase